MFEVCTAFQSDDRIIKTSINLLFGFEGFQLKVCPYVRKNKATKLIETLLKTRDSLPVVQVLLRVFQVVLKF